MSDFEVPVESIGAQSEHHSFSAPPEWWTARDTASEGDHRRVERAFRFEIDVARVGADLLVTGDFDGAMELECSRCAKRYSQALRDEFRLLLSPLDGREKPAPEALDPEGAQGLAETGICLGEELEAGWFKGPLIRFGDFFGEVVALALPLQPLCDPDCAGVCPHCGADRAAIRCACADEKIESPFAVLARLKEDGSD